MPIFEYACRGCGKEFETLVRASSPAPECPDCHSGDLEKKLSAFAVASATPFSRAAMPSQGNEFAGCGSCGHPGGPGACQFDA
jgi:putative FmdB family regulatory protein